jgi:hypothetical protein
MRCTTSSPPARYGPLRHPQRTAARKVPLYHPRQSDPAPQRTPAPGHRLTAWPAALQPTPRGTVEPVFANIRHNKRLARLNLRGRAKVNAQWHLYCMVHNIEKLAGSGWAGRDVLQGSHQAP